MNKHLLIPRYIFWPMAYLATLAVSMFVLWWFVLIGGNPFTVRNIDLRTAGGVISNSFLPGDIAVVKREVCAKEEATSFYHPSLRNEAGVVFMLQGGLLDAARGCHEGSVAFTVPRVPPGRYQYIALVRFQTNLVGRDEYTAFPPLEIEVLP